MIKELRLRNFKNFDRQDFTFSPGLNFIHGANGQGKSNIVEAVVFAMFGPRALRTDRENTVRWGAVGDSFVELTGELFSDEFTVKRYLNGKVQLKISDGTETKRAQEVAKYFGGIFIDLKTFLGTCACFQKEVDVLAKQDPAKRRDFISKVLCLDVVNDCIGSVGDEIKNLRDVDILQMTSLINEMEKAKQAVENVDLSRVNTAYNLLQELQRVKGKDPVKAREKLEKITTKIQKLEELRADKKTLVNLYREALKNDLNRCPICKATMAEDLRETIENHLPIIAEQEGIAASDIQKLRGEMMGLQAEANLNDPKTVQLNLDQTGIQDPTKAFENLRHYETLKAQLALLHRDLPEHKIKKTKEELKQMFRDFREYVLIPYFGVINFVMTEYLTTNTQFSKFSLNEDYTVVVDDKPLASYSGGQIDLICTLFRLAAARVMAELRYGRLPFMLFDSFADALDDNNFSLVMGFLQTQLPNVDQVIITAHHNVSVPGAYRINL